MTENKGGKVALNYTLLLAFLWSQTSIGKDGQIPNLDYLIFSPDRPRLSDAAIKQAPIETDKSRFKDIFFEITGSENSQKAFLLKRSDKKYYKFLLDPFEVKSQPIKSGNIKPLMAPLKQSK